MAARRRVPLMEPRWPPGAGPTRTARDARGYANARHSGPPRSLWRAAAGPCRALLRVGPYARSMTQEIDRSAPNSAFLAATGAGSPWLLRIAGRRSGHADPH